MAIHGSGAVRPAGVSAHWPPPCAEGGVGATQKKSMSAVFMQSKPAGHEEPPGTHRSAQMPVVVHVPSTQLESVVHDAP